MTSEICMSGMTRIAPKSLTILVDSREQRPLPIPASTPKPRDSKNYRPFAGRVLIKTKPACMEHGDYAIKGFEHACLVERKGSLEEIWANLFTGDWARQQKAFRGMVAVTKNPILLLDFPWTDSIYSRGGRGKIDPDIVWSRLAGVAIDYNLTIIGGGVSRTKKDRDPALSSASRKKLAAFMVALMLYHYLQA